MRFIVWLIDGRGELLLRQESPGAIWGSTAADVRDRLTDQLQLPTGYFVDVGGKIESQERASRSLIIAIAISLLAVFILLLPCP